ncbi:MAG TPA: hypothetical protein VE820_04190 [Sphingomicrobium sp.]|jgi:hypothetical protein|nr:hypothetical protein [Sphingomicrobium sp.]
MKSRKARRALLETEEQQRLGGLLPFDPAAVVDSGNSVAPDELARIVAMGELVDLVGKRAKDVGAVKSRPRKENLRQRDASPP